MAYYIGTMSEDSYSLKRVSNPNVEDADFAIPNYDAGLHFLLRATDMEWGLRKEAIALRIAELGGEVRSNRPLNEEAKGRLWGEAHGYFALSGGWVYTHHEVPVIGPREGCRHYSKTGWQPVCQGWANFYARRAWEIEQWLEETPDTHNDALARTINNFLSNFSSFTPDDIQVSCPVSRRKVLARARALVRQGILRMEGNTYFLVKQLEDEA